MWNAKWCTENENAFTITSSIKYMFCFYIYLFGCPEDPCY
jgi:hypothetical protein